MVLTELAVISAAGLLISAYALRVDIKSRKSKGYKPICDINDKISCTAALTSGFGHLFGFSNAYFGLAFYALVLILAAVDQMTFVFYLAILAILYSIYSAGVLVFKIKSLCLVCISLYIINILLLIFSWSI